MATDADGNTFNVGDKLWCDDGHSPDWVQGTVTSIPTSPANSCFVQLPMHNAPTLLVDTLVHSNKPPNPPDR